SLTALCPYLTISARPASSSSDDPAPPHISTLSLHDALPIYCTNCHGGKRPKGSVSLERFKADADARKEPKIWEAVAQNLRSGDRSEEHTSELQSLTNLVCRLLLGKKKRTTNEHQSCRGHTTA